MKRTLCANVPCKNFRRTYDRYCPGCRNEINRAWREANPEKMKDARAKWRRAQA